MTKREPRQQRQNRQFKDVIWPDDITVNEVGETEAGAGWVEVELQVIHPTFISERDIWTIVCLTLESNFSIQSGCAVSPEFDLGGALAGTSVFIEIEIPE